MDSLDVRLLGPIRLAWHGRPVGPLTRGARALTALLALQSRPRAREVIAGDLWPDGGRSAAGSLRQALWVLRTALSRSGADPDLLLAAGADEVGFRSGSEPSLDVVRFERHLRARPPRLEEAVGLYGGELAEGCELECFSRERERLADLFEDALAYLATHRLADGELESARATALEVLRRDPLREEAHVVLIEVYARTGTRSQVTRQYRRLRSILASELGVEPLPETEVAYRAALRGCLLRSAVRTLPSLVRQTTWAIPPVERSPGWAVPLGASCRLADRGVR